MIGYLFVLVASVAVGTVVHELSHAVALRAFRIPHEIEWVPDRAQSGPSLRTWASSRWAIVTYHSITPDLSTWKLRVSAMMPFGLAMPVLLLGVVHPELITGSIYGSLAAIGWLACAIPSPADFSIFWDPDRSITMATSR